MKARFILLDNADPRDMRPDYIVRGRHYFTEDANSLGRYTMIEYNKQSIFFPRFETDEGWEKIEQFIRSKFNLNPKLIETALLN